MILLDTNVVSEIYRPEPSRIVIDWIDLQPRLSVYLCTPVLAELRYGMECLVDGARKDRLRATIERLEGNLYRDRILVLDTAAAAEYGHVAANCRKLGRPINQMDGLIAAIGLAHSAVLATRNAKDFSGLGLDLVNPFEAKAAR